MNIESARKLPLFPSPYPGESFYSVLCRYHVRSCNTRSSSTITQLFGKLRVIRSSLLIPFRLPYIRDWVYPESGITPESMLFENTAFPLIGINMDSTELKWVEDLSLRTKFSRSVSSLCIKQRMILNSSHTLRYCPICAREQKKIYGESYWQVLPQIKGVEYCPSHGTRILSTSVSVEAIDHRFYPASDVVEKNDYSFINASNNKNSMIDFIAENYPDRALRLSRDIKWIFDNGSSIKGLARLYDCYCKVLGLQANKNDYSCRVDYESFAGRLKENLPECLLEVVFDIIRVYPVWSGGISVRYMSTLIHPFLMGELAGSAQKFYGG